MKVGYIRVSTRGQNLSRQIAELKQYGCEKIYHDKESGKDFNRENFQKMKKALVAGDELVVKELDRFGRNKEEIHKELSYFKENNITPRILDIPTTLLDFKEQTWVSDMITNIMVEVLSSFAQEELRKNKQRQKEGILEAKKQGVKFGRPKLEIPQEMIKFIQDGAMSVSQACKAFNVSRGSYYNFVKNQ